jgi:nitrogenase molybdenum-iron protein NifN
MIAPVEAFSKFAEGEEPYPNSTTNACKVCTPLGACLAFRGVAGAVPFLHGSQGCATYMRRYLISHFREPMDIAASNFTEHSAVFGGGANLKAGLANVLRQYNPALIGLATTCLSETIGEDMKGLLGEFTKTPAGSANTTPIVNVSTASFRGTHVDGFHAAVKALVESLCPVAASVSSSDVAPTAGRGSVSVSAHLPAPLALFPGMLSPADFRELKRLVAAFDLPLTLLPDYADTLDGPSWADYEKLPSGGTTVDAIRTLGSARAAIECGRVLSGAKATAGTVLHTRHSVPLHRLGLPIGLRETDALLATLSAISGQPVPASLVAERGRLIDSWVDGHKYIFEKRVIVFGDEDMVVGLTALLTEIGIVPVLCASGGRSGRLAASLRAASPELDERTTIREGVDYADITALAETLKPDFLLGASKGYSLARKLNVPLIRCGFPIHDRIGGQRVLHVGYAGAQQLFDQIVNTLLDRKQSDSPIGYAYL